MKFQTNLRKQETEANHLKLSFATLTESESRIVEIEWVITDRMSDTKSWTIGKILKAKKCEEELRNCVKRKMGNRRKEDSGDE
jgi:hypothetical protein